MAWAVPVGALGRRVAQLVAVAVGVELVAAEVACSVLRVAGSGRPPVLGRVAEPASDDEVAGGVGVELGVAPEHVAVDAGQELGLAVEPRSAAAAGSDVADCCSGSTQCSACPADSTARQGGWQDWQLRELQPERSAAAEPVADSGSSSADCSEVVAVVAADAGTDVVALVPVQLALLAAAVAAAVPAVEPAVDSTPRNQLSTSSAEDSAT